MLSIADNTLRQMCIGRKEDVGLFEFTPQGLQKFREAVVCWQSGGEDFGLAPTWTSRRKKKEELGSKDLASGELWFWTPRTDP